MAERTAKQPRLHNFDLLSEVIEPILDLAMESLYERYTAPNKQAHKVEFYERSLCRLQ